MEQLARDVYTAMYRITQDEEIGATVATAFGRSFHDGMYAMGPDAEAAKRKLAAIIAEALRGPLGAARGFTVGRFTRVMLLDATMYTIDELPTD